MARDAVTRDRIQEVIRFYRGQKVMLRSERAVRVNIERRRRSRA